jgi:hypothetical protein
MTEQLEQHEPYMDDRDDDELFVSEPPREATRTEKTLAYGQLFKNVVMVLGQLAVVGLAIASFVTGYWIFGLVLLFVGVPVWLFASDIVTGLLIAPFVGTAYLFDRRRA